MVDNFFKQCSIEAGLTASSENIVKALKSLEDASALSNSSRSCIVQIGDVLLDSDDISQEIDPKNINRRDEIGALGNDTADIRCKREPCFPCAGPERVDQHLQAVETG